MNLNASGATTAPPGRKSTTVPPLFVGNSTNRSISVLKYKLILPIIICGLVLLTGCATGINTQAVEIKLFQDNYEAHLMKSSGLDPDAVVDPDFYTVWGDRI